MAAGSSGDDQGRIEGATPPSPGGGLTSGGGFTIVEMLVLALVFGLLAAIGLSALLARGEKARDAVVKSDLRSAANAQAAFIAASPGRYANSQAELENRNWRPNTEVAFDAVRGNANRFCLEAHHVLRPERVWVLDSRSGDMRMGSAGACPPL